MLVVAMIVSLPSARSGSDRSSSASKLELPRTDELGVGRGRCQSHTD